MKKVFKRESIEVKIAVIANMVTKKLDKAA